MRDGVLRVLTLLVRFGTDRYPTAAEDLDGLYARRLAAVERTTIVVDNAREEGYEHRWSPRARVIGGDNRQGEFSGWDRAVALFGWDLLAFDFVHLCTSAFGALYTGYLDRLGEPMLRAVQGGGVALGHIDYFPRVVRVRGYWSQHWLRTSCVFLPPAELLAVRPLAAVADRGSLFSGDAARPFRADAPLSAEYQDLITDWLTGEGSGQGVVWHSRFSLTAQTRQRFEDKTVALLNEHLLSIRLRAQGCRLVDVTWAHGVLAGRPSLPEVLPDWRAQLAERPVDAIPLERTAPGSAPEGINR